MKKSILIALAGIAAASLFASCGGSKTGVLDSGATYEFIVGKPGSSLKEGDLIELDYNFKIGDSLLNSSAQVKQMSGQSSEFSLAPLDTSSYFSAAPVPLDGLYKMNQGDSVIFKISSKVFFEKIKTPSPDWIKETDTFVWEVKLTSVKSAEEIAKKYNALRKIETHFLKTENDLEYQFTELGNSNRLTKFGDVVEFNLIQKVGDSLLMDSKVQQNGETIKQVLTQPREDFDLMSGLAMMRAGDKATFRIPIASLMAKGMPKQEWMDENDYIQLLVDVVSVKSQKEIKEEEDKKEKEALSNNDKEIQEYLKAANITNYKKTESGLYYVVHTEGTGATPNKGQEVTVNYTGKLTNGKVFDSNVDPTFNHVEPFKVNVGEGRVIKGWDEGLALFNKGTKATLYIPSSIGYGSRGAGADIPGNAVLIFDIEILDIN
jgi:FKBP-type peptidyl-prolyl cis-trans isomerase FkpA